MMRDPYRFFFACGLAFGLGLAAACGGSDGPSAPTTVAPTGPPITAPTIVAPEPGATVETTTPTLTVGNATGGSGPLTYRFEVALDEGFAQIVASEGSIPAGEDGETSWVVDPPVEPGETYFWRARASAGGQEGPSSETARFSVLDPFAVSRPTGGLVLFDPLTNGTSVGEVVGGTFVENGWMATSPDDYIRYQVPQFPDGFVEFDVTNIREPNPVPGKRMLMIMWDPTKGEYTTNPFRMHLRKMDRNTVNRDDVRLRWVSRGEVRDTGISFFDFQRDIVYPWRVEWGTFRGEKFQQVRVYLEGVQILVRNYSEPYRLKIHWVELGGAPRSETLEEAIFSNVRIGARNP